MERHSLLSDEAMADYLEKDEGILDKIRCASS